MICGVRRLNLTKEIQEDANEISGGNLEFELDKVGGRAARNQATTHTYDYGRAQTVHIYDKTVMAHTCDIKEGRTGRDLVQAG